MTAAARRAAPGPAQDVGDAITALDALLARHDALRRSLAALTGRLPETRAALVSAQTGEKAAPFERAAIAIAATREAREALEALAGEIAAVQKDAAAVASDAIGAWRVLAPQLAPGLREAEAAAEAALRLAATSLALSVRDLNAIRWALGSRLYHAPKVPDPVDADRAAADLGPLADAPPTAVPHLDDYERLRGAVETLRGR